jgi:hypothetical protein
MIGGAFVLPFVANGTNKESNILSPAMRRTRHRESTIAIGSSPMRHVPTG